MGFQSSYATNKPLSAGDRQFIFPFPWSGKDYGDSEDASDVFGSFIFPSPYTSMIIGATQSTKNPEEEAWRPQG